MYSFQIVGAATYQPKEEYQRFVNALVSGSGLMLVEAEGNVFHIISSDRVVGVISLNAHDIDPVNVIEKRPLLIDLKIPKTDRNVAQFVRSVIARSFKGYSFYSEEWNCALPVDPNLLSFEINPLDNNIDIAIRDRGFIPRFLFAPTQATFGELPDGTIHLINSSMVSYFVREGKHSVDLPFDFSYPVSSSLQRFGLLFDNGLIPVMFYEYWQKSINIINHSFFDLNNTSRKLLIRPVIFDLETTFVRPRDISCFVSSAYDAFDGEQGSGKMVNTFILREGLQFTVFLKDLLSEKLKIADDFDRALVLRDVNYERDVDGVLIPQLTVHIFIEREGKKESIKNNINLSGCHKNEHVKARFIN